MKKILILILAAAALLTFVACAGNTPAAQTESGAATGADETAGSKTAKTPTKPGSNEETPAPADPETGTVSGDPVPTSEAEPTDPPVTEETTPAPEHKKVLVVVFSATGTTKRVAEKIASIEDADLYEIKAAQEYTSADLNWNDRNSRSTKEQNDGSVRPEIGGESVSLEGYEKIYIGYPIWWGEEPRIMDTFVESYDFGGITMIPFCTSSSSGIGRSGKNLADNAKSGNWLDGRRFPGSVSETELRAWIDGLI